MFGFAQNVCPNISFQNRPLTKRAQNGGLFLQTSDEFPTEKYDMDPISMFFQFGCLLLGESFKKNRKLHPKKEPCKITA